MLLALLSVFAGLATSAHASSDDGAHVRVPRMLPPTTQLAPPSRPLQWGDFNVLHTSDTHGWLLGHQHSSFPEPNYSGDFGDFASFVQHMKGIAETRDVDLLLVDSGDLHDGTGLADGGPPGSIDAHESNKLFKQLSYDVLTIGNHELYVYKNTLDMYQNFVPKYPGRYLSSNVNITLPGQTASVPVGSRFAKFTTPRGRAVTALGVLFNFTGSAPGTTVQPVQDMVKEAWFKEAIADEPDVFLLVGHMPAARDSWPGVVQDAIRAVHPTTPIMAFGGHTHIRNCIQYDEDSMGIESGRYMETVGWMSMNFTEPHSSKNTSFARRYLDANRVTYQYHTASSDSTFDTPAGQAITAGLLDLAAHFNLSTPFGTVPHDFYLNRVAYPSPDSILSLFIANATPAVLAANNLRAGVPSMVIVNSGVIRFDMYAGTFTKDDQYTVAPFVNAFRYVAGVPLAAAEKVLELLNKDGDDRRHAAHELEMYAKGSIRARYDAWLASMAADASTGFDEDASTSKDLTYGYVTKDSCPGVGDDTPHRAMPYHAPPAYIASPAPSVAPNASIDLVFLDFIQPDMLRFLNRAQSTRTYTPADVARYSDVLSNEVLGLYARMVWSGKGDDGEAVGHWKEYDAQTVLGI